MHTMNSMDVNKSMDDRKKRRRLIAGVLFTVYFEVLFYFFQKKWDELIVKEHITITLFHSKKLCDLSVIVKLLALMQ